MNRTLEPELLPTHPSRCPPPPSNHHHDHHGYHLHPSLINRTVTVDVKHRGIKPRLSLQSAELCEKEGGPALSTLPTHTPHGHHLPPSLINRTVSVDVKHRGIKPRLSLFKAQSCVNRKVDLCYHHHHHPSCHHHHHGHHFPPLHNKPYGLYGRKASSNGTVRGTDG